MRGEGEGEGEGSIFSLVVSTVYTSTVYTSTVYTSTVGSSGSALLCTAVGARVGARVRVGGLGWSALHTRSGTSASVMGSGGARGVVVTWLGLGLGSG